MKKTNEQVRDWLLENRVGNSGDLDLMGLDFSNFSGDVYINAMKTHGSLIQSYQSVGGSLIQNNSKVLNGDLYQGSQDVSGNLYQSAQDVWGNLCQDYQRVKGDLLQGNSKTFGNYWNTGNKVAGKIEEEDAKKILKEITLKELEELGYKLKEF